MGEFDDDVLDCFLKNQDKLFPEPVARNQEEAAYFLEDNFAAVVNSKEEVLQYFEEAGVDFSEDEILDAAEVFDIGDGRYLIVEG